MIPDEGLVTDDMPPNQATEGAETSTISSANVGALDARNVLAAAATATPPAPTPWAEITVSTPPQASDPHPQCGSISIAENDAASQLITEWMAHQDANPGFWLTWGAVELVVKHMRLVGGALVAGNAAILNDGGPRCHPGAHWVMAGDGGSRGPSHGVCSVCRQPDTLRVPDCHPFALAMSKGDGTLVCSHCGVEVGKQT